MTSDASSSTLLINATGPYQAQDYSLARACIAAGVHYLDLADARAFVTGITALDAEARSAGVLVVSGASTVPGLSGAVVDAYAPRVCFAAVGHAPSSRPATASIRASRQRDRSWAPRAAASHRRQRVQPVRGWQGLEPPRAAGPGRTLDQPLRRARSRAVSATLSRPRERPMSTPPWRSARFIWDCGRLSGLVRAGLIRNPGKAGADPLLAMKRRLGFLGSDRGGMLVTLEGTRSRRQAQADRLAPRRRQRPWAVRSGDTPSVLVASDCSSGTLQTRGAMPCLGLFTLDRFPGRDRRPRHRRRAPHDPSPLSPAAGRALRATAGAGARAARRRRRQRLDGPRRRGARTVAAEPGWSRRCSACRRPGAIRRCA